MCVCIMGIMEWRSCGNCCHKRILSSKKTLLILMGYTKAHVLTEVSICVLI